MSNEDSSPTADSPGLMKEVVRIGTRTWQFIEMAYPHTKSWKLETPVWATKNHHFYEEKCGFQRVDTKEDAFVYEKAMT